MTFFFPASIVLIAIWFDVTLYFVISSPTSSRIVCAFFGNSKLYPDIDFCNSSNFYKFLIENNYSHSGLHVVGNPLYDSFFKKRNQLETESLSKKIQVLFAPTKFARIESHHQQTKESVIAITETMLKQKSQFDFFVKLHPSTQQYEEYEKYVHNIDKSVPIFQKGTIESYIERSDVLITFTQITTAFMYPLILRKPVIFCNFYGEKLLDEIEQIVFVCTDPSELQNTIHEAINTNHKRYSKIDKYLELSCFKTDGLSSKRIVEHIISLIDNKSKN